MPIFVNIFHTYNVLSVFLHSIFYLLVISYLRVVKAVLLAHFCWAVRAYHDKNEIRFEGLLVNCLFEIAAGRCLEFLLIEISLRLPTLFIRGETLQTASSSTFTTATLRFSCCPDVRRPYYWEDFATARRVFRQTRFSFLYSLYWFFNPNLQSIGAIRKSFETYIDLIVT